MEDAINLFYLIKAKSTVREGGLMRIFQGVQGVGPPNPSTPLHSTQCPSSCMHPTHPSSSTLCLLCLQYRWALWKIDGSGTSVVIDAVGSPEDTFQDFVANLPDNDCRYGSECVLSWGAPEQFVDCPSLYARVACLQTYTAPQEQALTLSKQCILSSYSDRSAASTYLLFACSCTCIHPPPLPTPTPTPTPPHCSACSV